jgi:hypothetical protein
MPVCVLTRVMSDSSYSQSMPNLAMLGTTRRATNSRAWSTVLRSVEHREPGRSGAPRRRSQHREIGTVGLRDGSNITRGNARTGSCRICVVSAPYLAPTCLLLGTYLAAIPLHFAHAIKKAERKLSVTTVPLVELASEGARKPLVLLVQPAQRANHSRFLDLLPE